MSRVPLPTLLSQLYVAFTIEFDNEWERRIRAKGWPPRFLVSYVMWANLMRWVTPERLRVGELEARANVWNGPIHLGRMEEWWRYVSVDPDPSDERAKPPRRDHLVQPSLSGDLALRVWDGLDVWVQDAWIQRFGGERIAASSDALSVIERGLDLDLPDAMPVLSYADGYATPRPKGGPSSPAGSQPGTIAGLIARVLLAFTLEFEEESDVSLAMAATLLRVLDTEPIPAKEVPIRAGVRKEATDPALKFLAKSGHVLTEGKGAGMSVRLSALGVAAHSAYLQRTEAIEQEWSKRFGEATMSGLRSALEAIRDAEDGSLLAEGLRPPTGCWRASKPYIAQTEAYIRSPRDHLPHHPLLTHRGGWPDGA